MKHIFAAVDLSVTSRHTAQYAADLAGFLNAPLTLLTVVSIPVYASDVPVMQEEIDVLGETALTGLEKLKKDIEGRTNHTISVACEVKYGFLSQHLMQIALTIRPDMIVMGAGKGGHSLVPGTGQSVTAVYHLPCPVLVVPDGVAFRPVRKVAIACDLKAPEKSIPIKQIEKFLYSINAAVYIVHVSGDEAHFNIENSETALFIQKHLGRFLPRFVFLTAKCLEDELHSYCDKNLIDLLLIIPKKHSLIAIFDRKHAEKIMRRQQIPTLALSC